MIKLAMRFEVPRRRLPRLWVVLVLGGLILSYGERAFARKHKPEQPVQQFYIVTEAISDAAPFWSDYILDVKVQQEHFLVRDIRIAPLDEVCTDVVTVKAAQTQITDASYAKLAGKLDLCSLDPGDFDRALQEARPKRASSLFDTARFGIVATCGSGEKVFHLPYTQEVDLRRLKNIAPQSAALWDLNGRTYKAAFREKPIFDDVSKEEHAQLERLGESLLPELRSGRFDRGFWNSCPEAGPSSPSVAPRSSRCDPHPLLTLLADYRSRGEISEQVPQLVNAKDFHFVKYLAPEFPPLAKMARIQGKVEMTLVADPQSGQVREARAVSGHPLLRRSALAAVAQWQFDPKAQNLAQPIRAVLDYTFKCH